MSCSNTRVQRATLRSMRVKLPPTRIVVHQSSNNHHMQVQISAASNSYHIMFYVNRYLVSLLSRELRECIS